MQKILLCLTIFVFVSAACFVLFYSNSNTSKKSINVIEMILEKAKSGNSDEMYKLGHAYEEGLYGLEIDYIKAIHWYQKAIKAGSSDAVNAMGLMYKNGNGVSKDIKKAEEFFLQAVEKNNYDAYYNLAALYITNESQYPSYINKAKRLLNLASDSGHALSMFGLGRIYLHGIGGEQDLEKARLWYQKAVDFGHKKSTYFLADLIRETSKGDLDELLLAGYYYSQARDFNQPNAAKTLKYFAQECSKNRDKTKIVYNYAYCNLAAYSDDSLSKYAVGVSYYEGIKGREKDYSKAFNWFLESAYEKMPQAQYQVAKMFMEGKGTSINLPVSYAWFVVAESSVLPEKQRAEILFLKDQVYSLMNLSQRRKAEVMSNSYLEKYSSTNFNTAK